MLHYPLAPEEAILGGENYFLLGGLVGLFGIDRAGELRENISVVQKLFVSTGHKPTKIHNSGGGFLGYDAVWCCGSIPTFRRNTNQTYCTVTCHFFGNIQNVLSTPQCLATIVWKFLLSGEPDEYSKRKLTRK